MTTRIVFFVYRADHRSAPSCGPITTTRELQKNAMLVNLGDPNEAVRELLGDPSSEGSCGALSVAPSACTDEYVYKYYYSVFQPQYEVVWFDSAGQGAGRTTRAALVLSSSQSPGVLGLRGCRKSLQRRRLAD